LCYLSWIQPLILWCDNTGAGSLAHNPMFHSRTKHIEIYLYYLRDRIAAKELDVRYVPIDKQISDVLTKPLGIVRFQLLRSKL
ncbi:Ty1/Copia family ribonuclease HI, partial [Klebsiella pneumoniae]